MPVPLRSTASMDFTNLIKVKTQILTTPSHEL